MHSYHVYILASGRNGTLYIGVTGNLRERIQQHKDGAVDGFTKEHNVKQLVYLEETSDIQAALKREKQLKTWKRSWKMRLIEEMNPGWKDLSEGF